MRILNCCNKHVEFSVTERQGIVYEEMLKLLALYEVMYY